MVRTCTAIVVVFVASIVICQLDVWGNGTHDEEPYELLNRLSAMCPVDPENPQPSLQMLNISIQSSVRRLANGLHEYGLRWIDNTEQSKPPFWLKFTYNNEPMNVPALSAVQSFIFTSPRGFEISYNNKVSILDPKKQAEVCSFPANFIVPE